MDRTSAARHRLNAAARSSAARNASSPCAARSVFSSASSAGRRVQPAAAAGATRLPAELAELNTLRAAHGEEAFAAALDRAVAFCRWRAADVRSILGAGAGLPGPKTEPGDALVLDLPVVPVRPLADYALEGLS